MRDEFSSNVKEVLAKRVGHRCSNPECRQPTSGPQSDPQKVVNVGVASHITAASVGGARYNEQLTAEHRSNPANGIWLCQKCGKLVDNDASRYTVEKLLEWKRLAEDAAIREIEAAPHLVQRNNPGMEIADQLEALAQSIVGDVYRIKTKDYAAALPALTESIIVRVQDLRWKHPGYLLLPKECRDRFDAILRSSLLKLSFLTGIRFPSLQ